MTKTHYASNDKIIKIITTNNDARFPRHDAKMAIVKMSPKPNSRCRQQWGAITVMFTHDEIRALLEAIKSCDPTFKFYISRKFKNKPEWRREWWQKENQQRVEAQRVYSRR